MISFRCPGCSRTLRVDDSLAGKSACCPTCRYKTLIPMTPSETATLPPAAPAESATLPPTPLDSAVTVAQTGRLLAPATIEPRRATSSKRNWGAAAWKRDVTLKMVHRHALNSPRGYSPSLSHRYCRPASSSGVSGSFARAAMPAQPGGRHFSLGGY